MDVAEAKTVVRDEIERLAPALLELSHSCFASVTIDDVGQYLIVKDNVFVRKSGLFLLARPKIANGK